MAKRTKSLFGSFTCEKSKEIALHTGNIILAGIPTCIRIGRAEVIAMANSKKQRYAISL